MKTNVEKMKDITVIWGDGLIDDFADVKAVLAYGDRLVIVGKHGVRNLMLYNRNDGRWSFEGCEEEASRVAQAMNAAVQDGASDTINCTKSGLFC